MTCICVNQSRRDMMLRAAVLTNHSSRKHHVQFYPPIPERRSICVTYMATNFNVHSLHIINRCITLHLTCKHEPLMLKTRVSPGNCKILLLKFIKTSLGAVDDINTVTALNFHVYC